MVGAALLLEAWWRFGKCGHDCEVFNVEGGGISARVALDEIYYRCRFMQYASCPTASLAFIWKGGGKPRGRDNN